MIVALGLVVVGALPTVGLCVADDPQLGPRIRGQVGDLDVEVIWQACADDAPNPTIRITGTATGGYAIHSDDDDSLSARLLPAMDTPSAGREAAALAVRALIQVLALPPEAPPPPPPSPAPPSKPSTPTWRGRVAGVIEGRWTGVADPAWVGGVRAGLRRHRAVFEIGGGFGWRRELADPSATITTQDHEVWAGASWVPWHGGTFDLAFGGRAGVVLFRRTTETQDPRLLETPAKSSVGGILGIEARLGWVVSTFARIEALVGADGMLGAPRFLYQGADDELEVVDTAWLVRPRVGLLLILETDVW